MENSIVVPQKKEKNGITYDPAFSLLDICPKELKAGSQRDICTSMFKIPLLTIAKMWKQPKCPLMEE